MALLASELDRLRLELGYPVLTQGAEPYVGITSLFTQVVLPYLSAGAITTSTSAVVGGSGAPSGIVLTSAVGFDVGARVVVDVDARQETVTVESLAGTSLTAIFGKDHGGVSYQVTVEGGEAFIREFLTRIREVKAKMATTFGAGALKQVDEIQFYDMKGVTLFGVLGDQLNWWRDQLAAALGIRNMWSYRSSGNSTLSVY